MTAFELLDALLKAKMQRLADAWNGYEQLAVIELVRAIDLFRIRSEVSVGTENGWSWEAAKHGIAPSLAPFMRTLDEKGDGIPWSATNDKLSSWADSVLIQNGRLNALRRMAAMERYGLASSRLLAPGRVHLEVRGDRTEQQDRQASEWIRAVAGDIAERIPHPHERPESWVQERLDRYVGVQGDWFIQYDSDRDLLFHFRSEAERRAVRSLEGDELPDSAMLGGWAFSEWRATATIALSQVLHHIAFVAALVEKSSSVKPRNVLPIYVRREDQEAVLAEQLGQDTDDGIAELVRAFTLTAKNLDEYLDKFDIPIPPYIAFGKYFNLLPTFGVMENPFTFALREIRRTYRGDWDRVVGQREEMFREDLAVHFRQPRHFVPLNGFKLRAASGEVITDIDAVILDLQTGDVGLVQLKWQDLYDHSLSERNSRYQNLVAANAWVDRVASWIGWKSPRDVALALGVNAPSRKAGGS